MASKIDSQFFLGCKSLLNSSCLTMVEFFYLTTSVTRPIGLDLKKGHFLISMTLTFSLRKLSLSSSPKRSSSPPKTPPTKWVASSTLQRRWASERIRNRQKSFNRTENDYSNQFTRFDEKTDSLLDINRSRCSDHADFKKSFMSTSILKVK